MSDSRSESRGTDRPFCAIGVDVGGTKIAAALVDFPSAAVLDRCRIPTSPMRGGDAVLADVERLCMGLNVTARGQGRAVQGIGVGICELVDLAGDVVSDYCILWKGRPVRGQLSQMAPTILEADVRAAALAEALFGAGRPFRQFLYVTVGTGISCCLVLDGEPFTGAHGATGTMASSPFSIACERCGHVNERTLEEIASGPALVARFNQLRPGAADSGQAVLTEVMAGDPDASAIARAGGEALGTNVGLLVNVLDPHAVVIGGGLGLSEGLFWESFVAATRRHIWLEALRQLPLLRAATGGDAGVVGAAAAAWRKFRTRAP